jgi:hypothetical protein
MAAGRAGPGRADLRPHRLTRIYLRFPPLWRALGKQFLVLAAEPR